MDGLLIWRSPARLAAGRGRFEWSLIVIERGQGERSTAFEWRPFGDTAWQGHRQWPSYDINNGMTLGLPGVTRELFMHWRSTVDEMLGRSTEPTPIGLQYVIPGCEKDASRGPTQLALF